MATYSVPMTSWANIAVHVTTDETDPEVIADLAREQITASLCHHCSDKDGLEVGDDWESVRNGKGKIEMTKIKD